MITTDLNAKVTSDKLNESMYKKFGTKINFEKYTREELENYRNLLRTNIHQAESSHNFNDLLSNETYQKDKYMVGVLNTKIKEMLGEARILAEKSKTEKQARTMAAAAHDPKFAKKVGIKQGVAKEFNKADKGTKKLSNAMKNKKTKEGIEDRLKDLDPKNPVNVPAYQRKAKSGDSAAAAKGFSSKGKTAKESAGTPVKPSKAPEQAKKKPMTPFGKQPAKEGTMKSKKAKKDWDGDGKIESNKDEVWGSRAKAAAKAGHPFKESAKPDYIDLDKDGNKKETMKKAAADKKKKAAMKESQLIFRNHVRVVNESLAVLLREDEEGKAKAITAASDMVNDFTTWMQRVGQYQTKSMIELADSIRAEFGQAEAETFKQAVAPALQATLETMTQQREAISHAVAVLAGEASDMGQMGGAEVPDMSGGADEFAGSAGQDSMNAGDEFGASDAAAGGMETSGRELRESQKRVAAKKRIAESHTIMNILSQK